MNVLVLNDALVVDMFRHAGHTIVCSVDEADLVCFTGGEDVHPSLYGEKMHPATYSNIARDKYEQGVFKRCLDKHIPMVGICRGGQFLNVMSGGRMWQDVDGHAIHGTHRAIRQDVDNNRYINVTSTHHQMMRPSDDAVVLLIADWVDFVETVGENANIQGIECVYYHHTNCLCFQPHPEYARGSECRELFFEYINKYLMGGE